MREYKIKVPTGLKDVTLEMYVLWLNELKLYEQKKKMDGITKDAERTLDNRLRMKMVQIFCRLPDRAIKGLYRADYIKLSNHLTNVLEEKPELQPIIKIKGNSFGFIPNLSKHIRVGEYVDLDDFMKDWDNYHRAMGVLYRPITVGPNKHGQYRIKEYDDEGKYDESMKQVTMDIVMGAVVFFWNLSNQLLEITPKYLQLLMMQMEKESPKVAEALEQNGDGINIYTHSLMEASLKLKQLINYGSVKPYFS